MKKLSALICWSLAALGPAFALAQASALIAQDAWVRKAPGADVAAVYLTLRNTGAQPVVVIGVQSPVASHSMLHETSVKGGQSQMRSREQLVIPPGQAIALEPGGVHVMLHGLKRGFTTGQRVPLVLLLANGEQVQVAALVRPFGTQ